MEHLTLRSDQELLPQLAQRIRAMPCCPSKVLCLLPNDFLIQPLQQALKQKDKSHFLPHITTLREWLSASGENQAIPHHQSTLILAQILRKYKSLYGKGSPWGLANNLNSLFNELTLQQTPPTLSWEAFKDTLAQQNIGSDHQWFNREARLVFTLWQAWHQQMQSDHWLDTSSAYRQTLELDTFERAQAFEHCFFILPHKMYQAEAQWLEQLHNVTPVTTVGVEHHTPASTISIAPCHSHEQQALLVTIAAHQAVTEGKQVAIIGEDRRLTRRIHALLSRFELTVDDKAGWTLSTTKIGACIEYWLQCIESDFAYPHLLDLLKSSYCLDSLENKSALTFRLEQDIVHHENIAANLKSYRQALHNRQLRAFASKTETGEQLDQLLEQLQTIAEPLVELNRSKHRVAAKRYLLALTDSLEQLGIKKHLDSDAAGQQILRLFDEFNDSQINLNELLSWYEFHQWLNQALEDSYFRPSVQNAQVLLLNYQQAHFHDASYRILYSADSSHLPPSPASSPFFNQQTRSALGMENKQQFQDRYHQTFIRLTQAPGDCLISWQCEKDGEPLQASPWLEQLNQQGDLPIDKSLLNLSQHILTGSCADEYPQAQTTAVTIAKTYYTAGSHQRLINCPYHYFASDLLQLKPLDEVRESMEKSDYGSRVHLCLEAFHRDLKNLPGPFPHTLSDGNKDEAVKLLKDIGLAVFARDTITSFEHRGWLKRWQQLIPHYIQWELTRQTHYRTEKLEETVDFEFHPQLHLKGRIDRIDQHREDNTYSLLDYKTGYSPSASDMMIGEDVQLSSYAFTLEHIQQSSYIPLGDNKAIHERNGLDGAELDDTVCAVKARLVSLHQAIEQGAALPAWGEQSVCDRCTNASICRRQIWSE